MNENSGILEIEADGRRFFLATIAVAFSLILHLFLLAFFSGTRLNMGTFHRRTSLSPDSGPLQIGRIQYEIPEMEGGAGLTVTEGSSSPVETFRRSELLSRPVDGSLIQPPLPATDRLTGEKQNIREPAATPARRAWEPHPEVLAIQQKVVRDEEAFLPRRIIPPVERIRDPAGSETSFSRARLAGSAAGADWGQGEGRPAPAVISGVPVRRTRAAGRSAVAVPAPMPRELFTESPAEVTSLQPVEDLLVASVHTYSTLRDFRYQYFQVAIQRTSRQALPSLPKDIVFLQDCSASLGEQRLYFCREGLLKCLDALGPADRFNIIRFNDQSESCFKDWTPHSPASLEQAREFIRNMKSAGNTDVLASLKQLIRKEQVAGRPAVALLITDGFPTAGSTRSSDIIGEFSKLNDGGISVFTAGVAQTANSYLLDLLSYCNQGDVFDVVGGRWGIPDMLSRVMEQVSRPVLTDLRFIFAGEADAEVYPIRAGNLYLDRPLILRGRCPKGTEQLVLQVVGKAGEKACDMIFTLPLGKPAVSKDSSIRENWARQKVYHLMGEYARTPRPEIRREIQEAAKSFRIDVPYEKKF